MKGPHWLFRTMAVCSAAILISCFIAYRVGAMESLRVFLTGKEPAPIAKGDFAETADAPKPKVLIEDFKVINNLADANPYESSDFPRARTPNHFLMPFFRFRFLEGSNELELVDVAHEKESANKKE